MSVPEPRKLDDDPTTEQILALLRIVGITGDMGRLLPRRDDDLKGGSVARWSLWVKHKYICHDDTPPPVTT